MAGDGPFVWLSDQGPPRSFHRLPQGGMCLSAFLFVRRGRELLLGRYADDPRWEELTGLDGERRRLHGRGWTVPASHMLFGEDPRDAARRIARDVLRLEGLRLGEPRVETEQYVAPRYPQRGLHYDVWFFVDAEAPPGLDPARPPWFADLRWLDPAALRPEDYGRSHEDIVARWLAPRP